MLVTVGATEAIAASVIGLVEPGSEVLLIEPFYDSYSPVIAMAGCHRVAVPLVADGRGFAIDVDALRRAVTPRTRALIVNSPHNPTGMVATDAELSAIAELAVEHDLLVITDEVYEQLVFDGRRHLPLAGYPGMAERTITISSAAKMFNVTGWKIGWACGPADLIAGVRAAKQYLTYVGGAPFQPAVAQALDNEDAWSDCAARVVPGQAQLGCSGALADIGFDVLDSFGTYFLCADPRPLGYTDSTTFCAELPERAGVAAIPMSAFCDPDSAAHRRVESPGALRLLQTRRDHGGGHQAAAGAQGLITPRWADAAAPSCTAGCAWPPARSRSATRRGRRRAPRWRSTAGIRRRRPSAPVTR